MKKSTKKILIWGGIAVAAVSIFFIGKGKWWLK